MDYKQARAYVKQVKPALLNKERTDDVAILIASYPNKPLYFSEHSNLFNSYYPGNLAGLILYLLGAKSRVSYAFLSGRRSYRNLIIRSNSLIIDKYFHSPELPRVGLGSNLMFWLADKAKAKNIGGGSSKEGRGYMQVGFCNNENDIRFVNDLVTMMKALQEENL